ncbi:uncharacterized protein METZ01_LOCUS478719 [marine metagenome]|uniref:Lipoprotein n=1 Tax=marine metagenome TaxID=408172 RepID=A0A383C2Q1_9ZZZZ
MTRMIKWAIGAAALFLLGACNVIGEGEDTESGISGDGVQLSNIQPEVGGGSNKGWSSASCMIVEGRTEWGFNKKHAFYISKPRVWDPDIRISVIELKSCEITNCTLDSCPESSYIAYTTKDWLCVGDYVKINGNDCLIINMEAK